MTYRGSFPPGQGYTGQPQHPTAGTPQYANGGQQYASNGSHHPPQSAPQYGTGAAPYTNQGSVDMNQNAYYHSQQQYAHHGAYNPQGVLRRQLQQQQQRAQQYYSSSPPRPSQLPSAQPSQTPEPSQPTYYPQHQQFQSYDGTKDHRPPPQPVQSAPVAEFVNPSFLQQRPSTVSSSQPPPSRPQLQAQSQTQPTARAVQRPSEPAPIMQHQQYPQTASVSGQRELQSPRVESLKTPSQIPRTKTNGFVSKRQGSVHSSTKSPSVGHAASPVDALPLLICVAEDCFSKAREFVREIGKSLHPDAVAEYHKLIATGLQCLAVALQSTKISPRLEARVRLRYASMLVEETTNLMDAETTLLKGINLCEKHRFTDLKFCMQYLHVKVLFLKNPKAAFISIDAHIADCQTYKQVQWVYAFLFLKAAFYTQAGTGSDHAALENLHNLASIANTRGDWAISVVVSILEGLAHLRTCTLKSDAIVRVQTCIANASKYQLEDTVRRPQLDVLLMLLDLACSLHQKKSERCAVKLRDLTRRMEEIKDKREWNSLDHEVLLPIRKQSQSAAAAQSQVLSAETAAILRQGDGEVDYLVLQTFSMRQAWVVGYILHGVVSLTKATGLGRSTELWQEALNIVQDARYKNPIGSLSASVKNAELVTEQVCYLSILIGFQAATLLDWRKVKKVLQDVEDARPTQRYIHTLHLYLKGAFLQGVAKTDEALQIFESPQFDLGASGNANRGSIEGKVAILAAFNRLWIREHDQYRDGKKTAELMDQLQPICEEDPDPEIRGAYHVILGAARINPPLSSNRRKLHISRGAQTLRDTQNKQLIAMSLSVMRQQLFGGVVGVQATKSAQAAVAQTTMSGNKLWQSVAYGMLAETYETDGKVAEARGTNVDGIRLANEAAARTREAFS